MDRGDHIFPVGSKEWLGDARDAFSLTLDEVSDSGQLGKRS